MRDPYKQPNNSRNRANNSISGFSQHGLVVTINPSNPPPVEHDPWNGWKWPQGLSLEEFKAQTEEVERQAKASDLTEMQLRGAALLVECKAELASITRKQQRFTELVSYLEDVLAHFALLEMMGEQAFSQEHTGAGQTEARIVTRAKEQLAILDQERQEPLYIEAYRKGPSLPPTQS